MVRLIIIIVTLLFVNSDQRSSPWDDSYIAAVVEYQVQEDNLQNYVDLIKEASDKNADIVVFPEMTLTKRLESVYVPINGLLAKNPIPALKPDLFDEILVTLSNASRQHQIYVVANVQEIMDCRSAHEEYCPKNQTYLFNTNVVFDRNGAVIDRYRKINLYGEYSRSPALRPDLGTFTTDFGVTFGHFVCFDILFQVPAVQVVQKNNLTDVISTAMWFSQLPYLSATQIQESYANAMDVNFLASGANNISVGSSGSGIYSGKAGALVSIMPGAPTTRLLVARVPKVPGQVVGTYPGHIPDSSGSTDELYFKKDWRLASQLSVPLHQGYQEITLTDKNVTCKFRIDLRCTSDDMVPQYRAFVQDGTNKYSKRTAGIAACAIIACRDQSSCPYKFNKNESTVVINQLSIEMTSYALEYNEDLACDNVVYYPLSFTTKKFPLNPQDYNFTMLSDATEKLRINYAIDKPQKDLISFGIWGRIFAKDFGYSD